MLHIIIVMIWYQRSAILPHSRQSSCRGRCPKPKWLSSLVSKVICFQGFQLQYIGGTSCSSNNTSYGLGLGLGKFSLSERDVSFMKTCWHLAKMCKEFIFVRKALKTDGQKVHFPAITSYSVCCEHFAANGFWPVFIRKFSIFDVSWGNCTVWSDIA